MAIRQEAREGRGEGEESLLMSHSVHYLASQYLADSSLSADVGQFDFSASVVGQSVGVSAAGKKWFPSFKLVHP